MSEPEFAEQYSKAERFRFIALYAIAGLAVILIGKRWVFPALAASAPFSHCVEVLGVNGAVLFLYGVLVGVPLSCAIFVAALISPRGWRVLREGRVPPAGEKVFHRTRVRRGRYAKISGYVQMFYPVLFLAIAIWGAFQAAAITENAKQKNLACPADHSVSARQ